jgi:hypothetical protein
MESPEVKNPTKSGSYIVTALAATCGGETCIMERAFYDCQTKKWSACGMLSSFPIIKIVKWTPIEEGK